MVIFSGEMSVELDVECFGVGNERLEGMERAVQRLVHFLCTFEGIRRVFVILFDRF